MSEPAVQLDAPTTDAAKPAGNSALRALALNVSVGATGLAPKSLAELMDFAQLMAKGGPMVGKAFREKPGACLAITMQAMRWGMDPFAVSQKAYVTNDSIAYEAQLVTAVINAHAPLRERLKPTYSGEGASRKCTIKTTLRGETTASEYISPAVGQITTKHSPLWKTDPDQQLFYYSSRMWARRFCPEVIMGVYTPDEMAAVDGDYERIADTDERAPKSIYDDLGDDPGMNQSVPEDPRPFLAGRGFAAMREEKVAELQKRMAAATSVLELDEALEWFTTQWRVSKTVWGVIQEYRTREMERIESDTARLAAEDNMDSEYAKIVSG